MDIEKHDLEMAVPGFGYKSVVPSFGYQTAVPGFGYATAVPGFGTVYQGPGFREVLRGKGFGTVVKGPGFRAAPGAVGAPAVAFPAPPPGGDALAQEMGYASFFAWMMSYDPAGGANANKPAIVEIIDRAFGPFSMIPAGINTGGAMCGASACLAGQPANGKINTSTSDSWYAQFNGDLAAAGVSAAPAVTTSTTGSRTPTTGSSYPIQSLVTTGATPQPAPQSAAGSSAPASDNTALYIGGALLLAAVAWKATGH